MVKEISTTNPVDSPLTEQQAEESTTFEGEGLAIKGKSGVTVAQEEPRQQKEEAEKLSVIGFFNKYGHPQNPQETLDILRSVPRGFRVRVDEAGNIKPTIEDTSSDT